MKSLLDDPLLAMVPAVHGYRTLGPVALFAEIGRGGMGAVFRGRHLNLDIDVAVKCLLDQSGHEELIARFRREAMLVAKIRSPHLVQVMDVRFEFGLHYIVMEFVAGETLEGRVRRRGALPPNEAVAIALDATRGLAAAHQKGVIHRDVKPGNVLVSTDGEVKLLDLGIAKGRSETVESAATMTTTVMGTPLYMPPEQFESAANVTPAADVYAMGATLAFLLLGRPAIRGRSLVEITREVTVRGFPDLQQEAPHLPAEVVALVRRATAMNPAARPADAVALAQELQRLLATLGGAVALADPAAMRASSEPEGAPSASVLAEIRRSVTTRTQTPLAEDDAPADPDAVATVVRSGPAAAAGGAPTEPGSPPGAAQNERAATATVAATTSPRSSRWGMYAILLLLGGAATAVAWQLGLVQTGGKPRAQQPPETGSDKPEPLQPGAAEQKPSHETTKKDITAVAPPPADAPAGPPDGDTTKAKEPTTPSDAGKAASEQLVTTGAPPTTAPPGAATITPSESETKPTAPSTTGDSKPPPPVANGPEPAKAEPKPEPARNEPAVKPNPEPAPPAKPAPTAAEVVAAATAAARSHAKAADWNPMLVALGDAAEAAIGETLRRSVAAVADEVLPRLAAGRAEDAFTAASERAAGLPAWATTMTRLAEGGSGFAALLLVESQVHFEAAKDKLVCADPATTLRWAQLAAERGVARGAFFAGELLRLDAAAADPVEARQRWERVHASYLLGLGLGDFDCAARVAGIYFRQRAVDQPLLWTPPDVDNLDAWAAGLARRAAAAGTARGHFTFAQFLFKAVLDKGFSRSSGLTENGEKTTYPKELEKAARLGYTPAIDELRRKEKDEGQRWAGEALQRLRSAGVIDR